MFTQLRTVLKSVAGEEWVRVEVRVSPFRGKPPYFWRLSEVR